ncbi:MAG: mannose-1-phosphate guanylyltransferase/mannose-6-phosphate isomerase, partial [Gammaproteobacteria bacterium]|nr:mannose-1-phosphate guanylyltransferase/mannose-6-phosphate isomerase [Gammaproteobacteria bacterium]
INTAVRNAYEKGKQDYDFFRVQKKDFMDCPSESIDYAVMEKVTETGAPKSTLQAAVIPLDAGWSDVGSWQSLWDVGNKDAAGNLIKGDVLLHDTKNSMIFAENRVVAGIGIEHLIVIETADAVLVADKSASQEVKTIVNQLKSAGRSEALMHRRVFRPWGSYEGIGLGERYQVKRITVNPGAALSLQMHHHRAEHWIVVKGTAQVTRGEKTFLLSENESTYIPIGEKHRLENPGAIPLEIVEVQSGGYLGEDDIVRFEDQYGRDSSS